MKNIPVLNITTLLKEYGLRVDKKLGQNFLHDPFALEAITSAAEIKRSDTVLEIGPGLGSLTRYLALSANKVIAVELDKKMIPPLTALTSQYKNVEIIHGDILKLSPRDLIHEKDYLVVANIPYYITSAIIRHLLENDPIPRRMVLTIQREVAERICAKAGNMSLLALSVQVYGEPQIAGNVPAEAFHPIPKVNSAILCLDVYPTPRIQSELIDLFFKLLKAGFGQKRKMLRNALSKGLHIPPDTVERLLNNVNIDPKRRAETLDLNEWEVLCHVFREQIETGGL